LSQEKMRGSILTTRRFAEVSRILAERGIAWNRKRVCNFGKRGNARVRGEKLLHGWRSEEEKTLMNDLVVVEKKSMGIQKPLSQRKCISWIGKTRLTQGREE